MLGVGRRERERERDREREGERESDGGELALLCGDRPAGFWRRAAWADGACGGGADAGRTRPPLLSFGRPARQGAFLLSSPPPSLPPSHPPTHPPSLTLPPLPPCSPSLSPYLPTPLACGHPSEHTGRPTAPARQTPHPISVFPAHLLNSISHIACSRPASLRHSFLPPLLRPSTYLCSDSSSS